MPYFKDFKKQITIKDALYMCPYCDGTIYKTSSTQCYVGHFNECCHKHEVNITQRMHDEDYRDMVGATVMYVLDNDHIYMATITRFIPESVYADLHVTINGKEIEISAVKEAWGDYNKKPHWRYCMGSDFNKETTYHAYPTTMTSEQVAGSVDEVLEWWLAEHRYQVLSDYTVTVEPQLLREKFQPGREAVCVTVKTMPLLQNEQSKYHGLIKDLKQLMLRAYLMTYREDFTNVELFESELARQLNDNYLAICREADPEYRAGIEEAYCCYSFDLYFVREQL